MQRARNARIPPRPEIGGFLVKTRVVFRYKLGVFWKKGGFFGKNTRGGGCLVSIGGAGGAGGSGKNMGFFGIILGVFLVETRGVVWYKFGGFW